MRKAVYFKKAAVFLLMGLLGLAVVFPAVYVIGNSFMSETEINWYYRMLLRPDAGGWAAVHFLPEHFSLESWLQILLYNPFYLHKFWNSLFLCGTIVAGQLVVSCLGGYAFARFAFRGRKILFFILIVIMIMPAQVTLVPNYIVLDSLHMLNTEGALIWPAVFSPFGTFLMTQIFKGISDETVDAARLEGAGTLQILRKILIPAGKGGVVSLALLCFIDNWNMVEQPMVFLSDEEKYPLSVFLAAVGRQELSISFACGMLAMLPVLFLFLFFSRELVQGISFMGVK